jgi:hypothetical protein
MFHGTSSFKTTPIESGPVTKQAQYLELVAKYRARGPNAALIRPSPLAITIWPTFMRLWRSLSGNTATLRDRPWVLPNNVPRIDNEPSQQLRDPELPPRRAVFRFLRHGFADTVSMTRGHMTANLRCV